MKISTSREGKWLVVVLEENRLDARVANAFKKGVQDLVSRGDRNLLLDFQKVEFLDSSGLGALVSCLKSAGKDGDMELCSVNPTVFSLMKLTRLDRVFTIHQDLSTALGR